MLGAPYATKKALREHIGQQLRVIETSIFGTEYKPTGQNTVVGPDPFRDRKWFATVTTVDGVITRVT